MSEMDPSDIVVASISLAEEGLAENPFLCVQCGRRDFACLDDVVFHILMEHDYIMVATSDNAYITYEEFMSRIAKAMSETIQEGGIGKDEPQV